MSDLSVHQAREVVLGQLAAQQHGRVSTAQLRTLGFDADAVRHRVRSGRLHRLHRGVYAVGHVVPSPLGNRMAAVLAVRHSTVGRRSAGAHLGLRPYSGIPEVIVPRGAGRTKRKDIVVIRATHLHAKDITVVDGIPVTTFARTALDLAAVLDHGLDRFLIRAEQRDLFDLRAIEEAVARTPRHRGIRPLRAAVAELHPDITLTESDLELTMAALTRARGLPRPRFQESILGHRVDFFWPNADLVVETDGFEFHRTRTAFQADRTHDRKLQLAGYRVLRFTWEDLTLRPDGVAHDLAQGLGL